VHAADGDIVRSGEWRLVRQFAVDSPARQELAALTIEGEAGAGKSTLWRAGTATAADVGCRLLRSEPSAAEADSSFTGLFDLLADVLPEVADSIPVPRREALEVALLLRPAPAAPPTAHAIGLAVLGALRACASGQPTMVAIDDVQWLDSASLDALSFAIRRMTAGSQVSFLLAARTQAPADPRTAGAPPLRSGWRDLLASVPHAESIMLDPLDMWQVHNLLPHTVTAAQARYVARQSRGNPFWAKEIASSLETTPQPGTTRHSQAPVPPLARTLTERLARTLTPRAAEALATVGAAGRITVPAVTEVLGHMDDPAAALDEAFMVGVLVETEGRIAPAHPLIGASAVESLPPGRRASLYRRLAEASRASPERHAHFLALAAGPDPDESVAAALDEAADAAHARAANALAAQFATQAVAFTPPADEAARTSRRIRAAELLRLAGDLERSMEQLEMLEPYQLTTPELERALPLLLAMASMVRGTTAANAIITRAAEQAGPEPRRRALIMALASEVSYGLRGGRRAAAIEAIECAERVGPAAIPALHRALLNLMIAKVVGGEGLDAALLDRAQDLELRQHGFRLPETADLNRGLWARYVDDLNTARRALLAVIERAENLGDDFSLYTFLSYLAATEELAGDYAAAATALERGDAVARWHDWLPDPWHLEPRCELLIAAGRLDEAARMADELLAVGQDRSVQSRFMNNCVRGKVAFWQGDPTAAIRHLELAAACAGQCDWSEPAVRGRADQLLAEAYVAVGRTDEAERIAARLRDLGRTQHRPSLTGDAGRIDALVAAAAGDLDTAAEHARRAVEAHAASPLRPELARSLLIQGRIERRRKARKQSRAALRQARDLAAEMGHGPLQAEIERELPVVAAARFDTELTAAERRVADLIAAGATNRAAAAALFVSVRTVETHVASIYRKLGVRTRAELTNALSPR
jgi:DNA-binding CsgD family transcriptional regulator